MARNINQNYTFLGYGEHLAEQEEHNITKLPYYMDQLQIVHSKPKQHPGE